MRTYTAQTGDRLDQIVFKEYETLKYYKEVLAANTHLGNRTILKDGDLINLPVIKIEKTKISEVKTLW